MTPFSGALLIATLVLTTMETLLIINGPRLKRDMYDYMHDNCPQLDEEMQDNLVDGAFIDIHTTLVVLIVLLLLGFYLTMTGVM